MKRFSIPFFLILGLVQWSFSQSEFLLRGNSGFDCGLGISTNREGNGLNCYAGYSYRGFIDANLTYSKLNGGSVQGGVLSPSITFYPTKQEDMQNLPTIGISLGFNRYTSKTTETIIVPNPDPTIINFVSYQRVTESTINAWKLRVSAQRRAGYWKVFFFQPVLNAELSMKSNGWDFALHGGVSVGTRVVRGPLLILTPGVDLQSGITTFMLSFGVVF